MKCQQCGSENTRVELLSEIQLVTQRRSIFWWILVGWWWVPIKWIFLTIPAIIIRIFAPKRQKAVNSVKKYLVCSNCGESTPL